MARQTDSSFLTVGTIAGRLNEPIHRVEYAIRTRDIEPAGIAGNLRIFNEEAIEQVASALREIDIRREGGIPCNP